MIDVLLVDDHEVVRCGLKTVLERTGDFRVVGDAANIGEALKLREKNPHVVVMDLSIPGCDGIDGTREALKTWPRSSVLVLSAHSDDQSVISAIKAGARGFVVKMSSADKFCEALKTVAAGGVYLSSEVSHCLLETFSNGGAVTALSQLSQREVQVLKLVASGNTSKDIAASIGLSPETVRSYRKTLMKKLGVHNVAGLTQIALKEGVVRGF